MAVVVEHATKPALPESGDGKVSKDIWGEAHTVTGLGSMAEEDADDYYTSTEVDAAFQAKDADLTSWAAVTRASGFDTFAATPSSANLASLLTDELGGANKVIFAAGTLAIVSGKTLTASNTLTLTGTDASSVAFGAGGTVFYQSDLYTTAYSDAMNGVVDKAIVPNVFYDKIEALEHQGYKAAGWYLGPQGGIIINSAALLLTIWYVPFTLSRSVTISDLGARVVTNVASSNIKIAIYASVNGLPSGAPLAETGNISAASAAAVSADISGNNVLLPAGHYFAAMWADTTGISMQGVGPTSAGEQGAAVAIGDATLSNVTTGGSAVMQGFTSAEAYGSWPDASGETLSTTAAAVPRILLKAV